MHTTILRVKKGCVSLAGFSHERATFPKRHAVVLQPQKEPWREHPASPPGVMRRHQELVRPVPGGHGHEYCVRMDADPIDNRSLRSRVPRVNGARNPRFRTRPPPNERSGLGLGRTVGHTRTPNVRERTLAAHLFE